MSFHGNVISHILLNCFGAYKVRYCLCSSVSDSDMNSKGRIHLIHRRSYRVLYVKFNKSQKQGKIVDLPWNGWKRLLWQLCWCCQIECVHGCFPIYLRVVHYGTLQCLKILSLKYGGLACRDFFFFFL